MMIGCSQVFKESNGRRQASVSSISSDDDLILAFNRGSLEAFEIFIKRYQQYIYRLAYGLAGNTNDAEDIVSETTIRIFRHLATFHDAVTLPIWIKRIVTNIYNDSWRSMYRRTSISLESLIEDQGDGCFLHSQLVQISPHESAVASEQRHLLGNAIATLGPAQVEMISLYHTDGKSYEEISVQMQIPIGTVKSRLSRARSALKKALGKEAGVFLN